jgi:hypothetical protein
MNLMIETKTPKIAALNQEMGAMHSTNRSFWAQAGHQTKAARAQYHFRKDRLAKIRDELVQLCVNRH